VLTGATFQGGTRMELAEPDPYTSGEYTGALSPSQLKAATFLSSSLLLSYDIV
jgi:hypothetical protein